MRRRRFLVALATTGALAGCTSTGSDSDTEGIDNGQLGDDPDGSPDDGATRGDSPDNSSSTGGSGKETTGASTQLHQGYETTTVRVLSAGEQLGEVTAAIADTDGLRFTGLSETESLPEDRGMLFVYDQVGRHTYVMRRMDFGLDIVFADGEGVITTIHHAPEPGPNEDGSEQFYPGRGQYVLEVVRDWTTERGVTEGDRLAFTLDEK